MATFEDEIEVACEPKLEVTDKDTITKCQGTDNSNIAATVHTFPSILNNFSKLRSSTGNSSNVSYTSCTSLLTQYIKVENKLKWKFLPEQQAGCLLVITEQILNDVLDEEKEVWTGFQSPIHQNEGQNVTAVQSVQKTNKGLRYISHCKNLSLIHQYFQRFTKGNACVKLCIASPPPVNTGFSFPESVLRPIQQPEETKSHFAQFDRHRMCTEMGVQRQLGQLSDDEKRALELAYLCAEFPVLSAPPPPELELDEVEDIRDAVPPKEAAEYWPSASRNKERQGDGNRAIFQSIGGLSLGSSFCSRSNTLSPISTNTFDINLIMPKAPSPLLDKVSEDECNFQIHADSAINPRRKFSESQHIETVEMLLAHLRQAFGLGIGDFTTVGKSVRSKVGLFVKGYSGKSETLYRELEHRYQVLDKGQHPYYRQNAFPSKSAYDCWLREEKATIIRLIDGFYHKKEADVRAKPSLRVPLPRDLHKSYSILLSTLLQFELGNCLTGYLNPHEDENMTLDSSIDSLQQLASLAARTEKETFHPSTTRLLEEYALRYGISQTYRHLALLDCLTREFNIHTIQDCKIIESILSKLISKLNRLGDVISAHPRPNKPQAATMILLRQERNIFLQSLNQLSRKIQQLITNGIENIVTVGCTTNTKVSVKRILNRSILLLELVMDTYQTLSNLTSNQTKGKNNSGSVKEMLSKWLKGFVAETYGQQKLRIASEHRTNKPDPDSTPTLSAVILNKLLSVVSVEIRRIREYYQEPLRNYFNASQLVTSEYYRFICQDIEYLCKRHCRELKTNMNGQKIEEKDLNMLGLMFNLDQQDTVLWTSYLPQQSITWREEFLRLFIEKWNASIRDELSNFIKALIKTDEWEPNKAISSQDKPETERDGEETNLSPLARPLAQSGKSAFSTLQTHRHSSDSGERPMIPQSAHTQGKIKFTTNRCSSISEDEAMMRDKYVSPSSSESSQYELTTVNGGNLMQPQSKVSPDNPPSFQPPKLNLNLSVIPVRDSPNEQNFLSIGSSTSRETSNSVTPTPHSNHSDTSSPVAQLTSARFKLPLSNSIVDLIIVIARYNALIINILQTLSPLKFIWNRSHLAHTGLPLEMLEVKKLVEETRDINTQMRSVLYIEASKTLSRVCLTFAYNLICMDYCGLNRGEALEILNGDETGLIGRLDELKRERLAYGCRHTKQYGINSSACRESRHSGKQPIEKLSKDVALRINNLYVLATMWERLNSQLLSRMSTRNLSKPSAYFWSTTTTDMQSSQLPHKHRSSPVSEEQLLDSSDQAEEKRGKDPASETQQKLEEALRFEINILAYRINSGFLQLFSVLIELNLPQFNEKQRLAPALNYLGDCLNYLGRYLYPDAFKYLLQRIWYNAIKELETKVKAILNHIGSGQRASKAAELYLHVLSCLINFFKSTPDSSGLNAHLLMETSEFFSYLLHFHLLESKSLLRVFNALVNEPNTGYQIDYSNSKLGDSQLYDIENTITAHTGLSRGEVMAYLHVKLSSFRKSFTGKELKQALIALRAETLPNEWKGAQYEWGPIAVEICKELIKKGDIEELSTSVEVPREERGETFSLTRYYRMVHIRRVVSSISLNREERETDFPTRSLSNQDSQVENEEAKLKTMQYLYEILRMREKEPMVREFLRNINEELVATLSRDRNGQFDKLLIVHEL